jgi:hypothetical protein
VGFRQDSGYSITGGNFYTYWFYIGPPDLGAADTKDVLPSNITFDRTLFYGTYEPNKSFSSVFLLNVKNFVIKNSYVGGINGTTRANASGGVESKVLLGHNHVDPLKAENNLFCCGWTEGMLTGGNAKSFATGAPMAANIDYQHNIHINALRFLPGTSSYIGSENRPQIKNCFELKEGTDAVFRWNTCLNSWANDFSQWFGAKMASYQENYPRSGVGAGSAGATLSAGDNGPNSRVTIAKSGQIWPLKVGVVLGISRVASPNESLYFTDGEWEYRRITRVEDGPNNVYHVDSGYTSAYTTTNSPWMVIANPWTSTQRVDISNNLFRNVATALEMDGDTADYGLGKGLGLRDIQFRNNLQLIDSPEANFYSVSIQPSLVKLTWGGKGITIDHNQTVMTSSSYLRQHDQNMNSIFYMDIGQRMWESLKVTNNLGAYTDGGGPISSAFLPKMTSDFLWSNNSYVGTTWNSNGANPYGVTGTNNMSQCMSAPGKRCFNVWGLQVNANVDYRYRNPSANDFSVKPDAVQVCGATNANPVVIQTCTPHNFLQWQPVRIQGVSGNTAANGSWHVKTVIDSTHFSIRDGWDGTVAGNGTYTTGGTVYSALWQGGNDGKDIGADIDNVPLIRSLTVTPMAYSALFRWAMPSGAANRACQVEVSEDSGLLNDDGDYVVVNSLRPDYFIRADSDSANARATRSPDGILRWFQVGDPATATGDDGQVHDLALTRGAKYYYRITCGGLIERGSFTTKTHDGPISTIDVKTKTQHAGATRVRARYGAVSGSLTTGEAILCASGCTVTIPASSSRQVVYYLDELDGNNNVVYSATTPSVVAVGS